LDLSWILTSEDGKEFTRDIVIATIARYSASNSHAGFDIVSRQLEKFCHSFYNQSDLHFFKVSQKIIQNFLFIGLNRVWNMYEERSLENLSMNVTIL
jgi:hypothetical protein